MAEQQLVCDLAGLPRRGERLDGVRRVQHRRHLAERVQRTAQAGRHRGGERAGEAAGDLQQAGGRRLRLVGGADVVRLDGEQVVVRLGVREGQQHLGQGDAVRQGVVKARDDDRATVVPIDDVEVPQRSAAVDRLLHLALDEDLERGLVPGLGQGRAVQVVVDREVGVVLPVGHAQRAGGLDDDLAEDGVAVDEAVLQDVGQALPVDRPLERHDALDDHEVLGAVHRQPDGVDGAHGTSSSHRITPFGGHPQPFTRVARRCAAVGGITRCRRARWPPADPASTA